MKNENLVSLAEVSRLTGKDFKTIKKRIVGIEPEKKEGVAHLYNAKEILELLYTEKDNKELDLTKERAKLVKVQRKKAELELEEMNGKFMTYDHVVLEFQKMTLAVRAKLLTIPFKLSPQLVSIDNPREIAPILKAEIYEILDEIADDKFGQAIGIEIEPILKKLKAIEKMNIPVF